MAAKKRPHFIMVAGHDEQERFGTILKNQTEVQSHSNLEISWREFSDAQALVPMWMAEVAFQELQRPADFNPCLLWILPHNGPETSA